MMKDAEELEFNDIFEYGLEKDEKYFENKFPYIKDIPINMNNLKEEEEYSENIPNKREEKQSKEYANVTNKKLLINENKKVL